jgi:adenylate cyclase
MTETAYRCPGSRRLKGYLLSVVGWTAAVGLFLLVRFVGLQAVPQFRGLNFSQIDHSWLLVQGLCTGWGIGSVFYLLDVGLDRPAIRRRPYGMIILIQTVGNVGLVLFAQLAASLFDIARAHHGFRWSVVQNRLLSSNFLVVLVYATVVSSLFFFLKQVNRKFGPGNLWKLIIGMYHHPREEERIFMFLDLKGSTTHAERLGHVQFSRLIQDCFIDLTVVIDHQAQVYQYVGDEVILFWDVEEGLRDASCIRAYFRFTDRLRERAEHYQKAYGVLPVFKAGLNIGSATVLEVGEIKREIAYLGDVLNTAARIQGKCGELGEDLLVSEALHGRLQRVPDDLRMERIGDVALRGREQAVSILSVHRIDSGLAAGSPFPPARAP